jgi:ribosomal protein L23
MANVTMTKMPLKPSDLLFISIEGASEAEVEDFRSQFEALYPGIKAMVLNYEVKVRKVNTSGVRRISVRYSEDLTGKESEDLKELIATSIQALHGKKSRYSIIKEG